MPYGDIDLNIGSGDDLLFQSISVDLLSLRCGYINQRAISQENLNPLITDFSFSLKITHLNFSSNFQGPVS